MLQSGLAPCDQEGLMLVAIQVSLVDRSHEYGAYGTGHKLVNFLSPSHREEIFQRVAFSFRSRVVWGGVVDSSRLPVGCTL